ncbi:MAG: hypothetical protein WCC96_17960 [Rhodomicrobium sp.]
MIFLRSFALALIVTLSLVSRAASHPCAADAVQKAKKLMRLHDQGLHADNEISDGTAALEVAPIRASKGRGEFDVLEVNSSIYKATYRMHFIYMRLDGCPLLGQEIIEMAGAKG